MGKKQLNESTTNFLVLELRDNEREFKWKVVDQRSDLVLDYFYTKGRAWRALNRIARERLISDITVVPIDYEWLYNEEYGYYEWTKPKNKRDLHIMTDLITKKDENGNVRHVSIDEDKTKNERKHKMWKVVNTFNGSEEGYVDNYEEGEVLAEKIKKDYYSHPGRANDILPLDIVPANSRWHWNERDNRFEWDEGDTEYFIDNY